METRLLKATPRTEHGKGPARRLRAKGLVPAVAYGTTLKDKKNLELSLAVEAEALREILTSGRGRNSLIGLDVEGGEKHTVMIKRFEYHPVSRKLLHADFQRIDEGRPVIVEVPFRTEGKSKGVAEGGTLLTSVRTLKLKCLPTNIPEEVVHPVDDLEINDEVKVNELKLPEKVEVLMAPERRLITVIPPRVIAEPTEGEAAEGEEGAEAAAGEGEEGASTEGGGEEGGES